MRTDSNLDDTTETAGTSRQSLNLADFLVPGLIFVFCAVIVYLALQIDVAVPIVIGKAMQPRAFPIFLMALIASLNVVLIWQIIAGNHMPRVSQPPATWATMALMAVFYVLSETTDMLIALPVVMFSMSLLWGERRIWLAALVAIITPLTIFLAFDLLLQIRFPRGILTNLYYG